MLSPMTNPDSTDRDEALFNGALQLPEDQRAEYLRLASGGDQALVARVTALLGSHRLSGEFLKPQAKTIVVSAATPSEKTGDLIGRYKLLQIIGEGGCGVVYMAEQQEPVVRRVALKVIKLGMDTKAVVARFEAERQALAMMDHPNIAKVLDVGATETGRPFFVMELVRGIKITDYCNQNKLPAAERLELFMQVCQAIQHAHQKGIIHRDIKPSNILVTLHDGVPVPKVIDFGIAKATQGRLTDQTLFTAFEQFIGTPAYMSPEQAEMSGLDIDTRCDVYALGVLLYELLTGQTPFDPRELVESGLDKMRQTIREREPERPSTRLRTMINAELTATAERYRTDAPKLIYLLRGDIDWIVMKALEKDRTRRYESASGFARDVQRYLRNEPVEARPPSSLYRFQKLVRRNKAAFAASAAVVIALLLGLSFSTYLLVQERKARKRADDAEKVQAAMREQAEHRSALGEKIGLAALYVTQDRYSEAERQLGPVPISEVTNFTTTAFLYNLFAEKHARHGEWLGAITNLSKVMAIVPNEFPAYPARALLYARTGDRQAWLNDCEYLLHRYDDTTDPVMATLIADACLVLPTSESDKAEIGKMVNVALKADSPHKSWNDVYLVKALYEYRFGNSSEALDWVKKVEIEHDYPSRNVGALALADLVQHRPADDAVQTAKRTMSKIDDGLGDQWRDWIVGRLLLEEAQKQ
ncbi:MAG TPA: serine/threonine-protein kinase [Verrucomicrobiae bacterium]